MPRLVAPAADHGGGCGWAGWGLGRGSEWLSAGGPGAEALGQRGRAGVGRVGARQQQM